MQLKLITSISEMQLIHDWLKDDELGKQELSEYLKTDQWFFLLKPNVRQAFFIVKNSEKIGFIDLEVQDLKTAYFSFYILPKKRNYGFASQSIPILIKHCCGLKLQKLKAGVNLKNISSQRVLHKSGFQYVSTDALGYMYFELSILRFLHKFDE